MHVYFSKQKKYAKKALGHHLDSSLCLYASYNKYQYSSLEREFIHNGERQHTEQYFDNLRSNFHLENQSMVIQVYNGCINEPVTKASTAFHSCFINFIVHINVYVNVNKCTRHSSFFITETNIFW
jgi:hypothetical protein